MSTLLAGLLLLLSAAVGAQCPSDCCCAPGGLRVDCRSGSGTATLPPGLLVLNVSSWSRPQLTALLSFTTIASTVRVLYLDDGQLIALPENAFAAWHQLRWLSLTRSSIRHIDELAFSGAERLESLALSDNPLGPRPPQLLDIPSLRELQLLRCNISQIPTSEPLLGECCPLLTELWLSYNALSELPNSSFTELPGLQKLYLSNNRLIEIQAGALHPLHQLQVLDLSSNLLQELNADIFLQQCVLDTLYLSDNRLKSLGYNVFKPLKNLRILHLDHNRLQVIDAGVFSGMSSLNKLYLEYNEIRDVSPTAFEELSNLTHLYLSENLFHMMNVCSLQKLSELQYLRLLGGQLKVDCALWNVYRWSTEHGVDLLAPPVKDLVLPCNISHCPVAEEIYETSSDWQSTVILVAAVVVPLALLFTVIIITVLCCRKRKLSVSTSAVYSSHDAGYDTVAESSRSTTETDATLGRSAVAVYSREYPVGSRVNYRGPVTDVAMAPYSTSEDEEEALLTSRQWHRPPQHASLRVPRPGARRVLPRPASLQEAPPTYHLSDTEPQSSTLSDCSDSGPSAPALPLHPPPRPPAPLPPRPPPRSVTTATATTVFEDDDRRGLVV